MTNLPLLYVLLVASVSALVIFLFLLWRHR